MNHVEFLKEHALHMERQAQEKARRMKDTKGRASAPGPDLAKCDECGRFAPYARGDFGKPTDRPQRFCKRHAPESLKGPGNFPFHPQP